MDLTKLFYYIVSLSLMGSLLAIGLLIIKKLLGQKLGANWHYYIWLVLILRLMIPYTPSVSLISFNALNFPPHYAQSIDLPQLTLPSVQGQQSPTPATQTDVNHDNTTQGTIAGKENTQQPSSGAVIEWLNWQTSASIWILGVLAISVYILLVNAFLLFKIKKLPICESEDILRILQDCKAKLKLRSDISIVFDDAIKSPAILGLWQPKIIISPEIVKKLSAEELSYIFLHELSHLKRRDLLTNGLVLALQIVYWFNPIIWLALHQMKQDCEIACDATALGVLQTEDHKKYGKTIISLLQLLSEPKWVPGTLGFISKFNARRIIMISRYRRTTLKWGVAALGLTLVIGCSSSNNPINSNSNGQNQIDTISSQQKDPSTSRQQNTTTVTDANSIVYVNNQYGFSFTLPEDWKGYSIVNSEWQGLANGQSGETTVATGPIISIRDPRWTTQTPRQDIPIMVFTAEQWNSLQQGNFHIGAAPVGPSMLGRNNTYVFALPARYNYAFPAGYPEVETILKSSPLQPSAIKVSDAVQSLLSTMMTLGKQGKIINSNFAVKTNTIEDVEKVWGKADKTDYVADASGRYATYNSYHVVFGINKGEQIYEVRSYDSQLKGITLAQAKEVLGSPVYDNKSNGQEIIGYTAGSEFKIELVFPQITQDNPSPVLDHYNILYPQGTVNSMANYPGRQW